MRLINKELKVNEITFQPEAYLTIAIPCELWYDLREGNPWYGKEVREDLERMFGAELIKLLAPDVKTNTPVAPSS